MKLSGATKSIICITVGIFATQVTVFAILAQQGLIVIGQHSVAGDAFIVSYLAVVWAMILADDWIKRSSINQNRNKSKTETSHKNTQ